MAIFLFGFGGASSFRLRFLPESAILKVFRVDKVPDFGCSKVGDSVRNFFLAYHVRLYTMWSGYNSAEPLPGAYPQVDLFRRHVNLHK
jgi:hypothetical protein